MKVCWLISWVVLFLVLASCQYDPHAHLYLTQKPKAEDFTGQYTFSSQTVDDKLKDTRLKQKQPAIIIKPDGTFEFRHVPRFRRVNINEYTFESYTNRTGKWDLQTIGAVDNGTGKTKSFWGLVLDTALTELQYATFLGPDKTSGIIFIYDDPDSGDVMIFNKK